MSSALPLFMSDRINRKEHWESIYATKASNEVSWYQEYPVSLEWITDTAMATDSLVIDVGGGDSNLVDHLVALGYLNVTVLDISKQAIERAKQRLGEKSGQVNWVVSDVLDVDLPSVVDLWHDRAVFHFLTEEEDASRYVEKVKGAVRPGGFLFMATFSEQGPLKCSGIEIKQYSIDALEGLFAPQFELIKGYNADHATPFGTTQNFSICLFQRVNG